MQVRFLKASVLAVAFFSITVLHAQDKNEKLYRERATEVRQEIFDVKTPAFEVSIVPDEFKNESAVVIARSINYVMDANNKARIAPFGITTPRQLFYTTTIREKVKINDQAALNEFATFEYKKQITKATSYGLFIRVLDKAFTFIGVRITKPDGKVIEQNTVEEILTKDEKKQKEGKIAVAGLQIGDILEYYIRIEEVQHDGKKIVGPYYFVLANEHPIMNLDIRVQLDRAAGIAYKPANEAPDFNFYKTPQSDFVFSLNRKNIPRITNHIWSSPLRQLPYIEMRYKPYGGGMFEKPYVAGVVSYPNLNDYTNALKGFLASSGSLASSSMKEIRAELEKRATGNLSSLPKDSLAKLIYYVFQHYNGYDFYPNGILTTDCSINSHRPYTINSILGLQKLMNEYGIENELIVMTSANKTKLDNIIDYGEYGLFLRTRIGNPVYFFFDNRFTLPNEIPVQYQGQQGLSYFVPNSKKEYYETRYITLPLSNAAANMFKEVQNISFPQDNIATTLIDRTVDVAGYFKTEKQIQLCMPEETEKRQAQLFDMNSIAAQLANSKKGKPSLEELTTSFATSSSKWENQFKEEIKNQFGFAPKVLTNYSIKEYSLRQENSSFIYNSAFNMEGWVKPAGHNYIFEAGKLAGTFSKLDENERNRTIDVYMPCARSFDYTFNITVPQGYKAKGIEAFNKNVTNDAASFVATATQNDNVIYINCTRIYNNAFEPAANWPKLLEVMDAFYDFTQQKILFEKVK